MHLIIGCGYLGRRVAALWREHDKAVAALTRSRGDELHSLGINPIIGDILQRHTLGALPQSDVVLYAVGFDRASGASFRDVYVNGLANVLAALPQEPRRFLYVSSTSVYGHTDGEEIDETAPTAPLDDNGQAVLAAEELLRRQLPAAIVLRFAGIYGPGRLIRRAAVEKGDPVSSSADRWLNLIHVDDGARVVLAAEALGRPGGIYNVSDGHPVNRREFYVAFAKFLGAPPPRFETLPAGTSISTRDQSNRRIHNRRMCEELGITLRYPSFRDGLHASID